MRPEMYAQALLTLIKNGENPKEVIARMHAALFAKGRAALLPRIVRSFSRLAHQDMRRHRSILYFAKSAEEKSARAGARAPEAKAVVDETLIGGWRLEEGERLTDVSWKKHLLELYTRITK